PWKLKIACVKIWVLLRGLKSLRLTQKIWLRLRKQMNDFSQGQSRRGQGRSLLARGISYLSRREYSEYELRRKLAPHAESEEALDAVMQRLKKENWQSDSRFLQATANVAAKKWGAQRIAVTLRQHQLAEDEVNAALHHLQDSEY